MSILWIALLALAVFFVVRSFHTAAAKTNSIKQNYQSALTHWEAAYRKRPNQKNGIQYGYLLLRSGNYEQAEQVFEQVLLMDQLTEENKLQTEMMLGLVAWKKGDLDGAIQTYERLHQQGENTVVYANLGFLYLLRDKPEEVLPFLKKAYAYHDTNHVIIDNLAECYFRLGDYEQAETLLQKALRLPRPIAEIYYHYGVLLQQKGEKEQAISYFERAVKMDLNALSGLDRQEIQQRIDQLEQELIENGEE